MTAVRILLLTPFLPAQGASHGGGNYLGALAEGLRRRCELGVLHLSRPGEPSATASEWSWSASAPYEGAPSGASHRLKMLWRWRDRPLLAAKHQSGQLPLLVRRALDEFRPDVALVEMAQMAQFLPLLDGLPTVLTDHEAGRPANAGTGLGAAADRRDERLWRGYVQRFYPQASLVQAVTEEDAAALRSAIGRDVAVRPAVLPPPQALCRPGDAPPQALFLGDYRHEPNRVAARRIVDEIWPRVRSRCPDARLVLAGPNAAPVEPLGDQPGVEVAGYVEDLYALLSQTRLLLAPQWSGGGFRVKNAQSLLHGLPVVTNALGARGSRAPAPACAVAESTEALAAAACALLESAETARAAGELGQRWAAERFSIEAVADLQLARLQRLIA